jgi:hypothetical protein
MAKKLACRLGRHDWTTRADEGESYKVCAYCGKTPRGSRGRKREGPYRDTFGGGGTGGGGAL